MYDTVKQLIPRITLLKNFHSQISHMVFERRKPDNIDMNTGGRTAFNERLG
jgi:hypothetical protein